MVDRILMECLFEWRHVWAMCGGGGGHQVRPRQGACVDDGVCNNASRGGCGGCGDGRERRRGGRWSMGSLWSDCAKGIDSGRWAATGEGVEFGRGEQGQK